MSLLTNQAGGRIIELPGKLGRFVFQTPPSITIEDCGQSAPYKDRPTCLAAVALVSCKGRFVMSFPLLEMPSEIGGIKELAFEESAEILVARAVQGKVAGGRQRGFDVYKSALFPGQTFQVKTARVSVRAGEVKVLDGRELEIRDTYQWAFRVGHSEYTADWYILFGERDDLVYPFLLTQQEWDAHSSPTGTPARMLIMTAQEYSRCGRYISSYKRNRHWRFVIRKWPEGLLAKLRSPRIQLRLAI